MFTQHAGQGGGGQREGGRTRQAGNFGARQRHKRSRCGADLAPRVVQLVLELQVGLLEQLEILTERVALQPQLLDAGVARPELGQQLGLVGLIVTHF